MPVNSRKEVLVFVAGATPQIITETIYALSQKNPPIYPDSIYIITTDIGRRLIGKSLIDEGMLLKLCEEYSIPYPGIGEENFIVAIDSNGRRLEDIRSSEDNYIIAELIMKVIKEIRKDPSVRLHCSIAGGRKTMSLYLGLALQLFGKQDDKLYHVLISPPELESNPDFFYKPKKNKVIKHPMPDGSFKFINTKDAKIELAELPFIRLSDKLDLQETNLKEIIKESQRDIDTATIQSRLIVNFKDRNILIGKKLINMYPIHLSVYVAFLRQKVYSCKRPELPYCKDCTECFQTLTNLSTKEAIEDIAKDYSHIYGERSLKAKELLSKWENGMPMEQLRQYITKINKKLEREIPDTLLPYYRITSLRQYASTRYGVKVERKKIEII